MKRLALCFMLAIALLWSEPYGMAAGHTTYFANTYGAKGDGVAVDTIPIQKALDTAAAEGGGVVRLTPGVYLSGAIFLKTNTELRIDAGVTLRGVHDLAAYPMMPTRVAGIEMTWPAALVNVYAQKHAQITGSGTIDGDGKFWWDSYWALRRQYDAKGLRWAADYDARRPRLIQIYNASDVVLGGLTLLRSGFWTVHICYSSRVHVTGVTIRNNIGGRGPSTDGIDVDSSKNVLVEHVDIAVNDDALCLKAGRDSDGLRVNRPDEDILIRDAIVRDGAAAITIGSETSGGFRHIDVYKIHAFGHVPSGVLFKSAHTRGGWADDIRIHDLQLDDITVPVQITTNWNPSYSYATLPAGMTNVPGYYRTLTTPVPADKGMAHFRNVHLWNIKAVGASEGFKVSASPGAPLEDFVLDHLSLDAATAGTIADTQNWKLRHVTLHTRDGSTVQWQDAHGVQLTSDTGISAPVGH